MTKVFTFLLFLLMITHVACDGSNDSGQEIKKEEEQEQEQELEKGVDIPFAEYSLEGTSCQWVNLGFDECDQNNILVISSDEVLETYIEGTDYPTIDFSKQTLLLAYGLECYRNTPDSVSLQQVSEDNYLMTVNLRPRMTAADLEWEVAIVIDKLGAECKVELNITNK
ncbi:hypothetical protein [Parabacteroides sp. PF5-9]|uniref:hypothetical protein n=1 Tax=Parabacteroides sp. PF5-9 TaxID=1742404 RepID=UPI0024762AFD|nr:hypothetical protein [Parabacteroides sp. PF5-9]MDH6356389.1 hypothetical protein [Parabacteroides sp. PF5-9]